MTICLMQRVRLSLSNTDIADQLYPLRGQLINGGIFYQGAKDDANAYKYLARYVDSAV